MRYEAEPSIDPFEIYRLPFGVIMVILAIYFLILEYLKMRFVNYRTKGDLSIYLMIIFHLMNLATFTLNFSG